MMKVLILCTILVFSAYAQKEHHHEVPKLISPPKGKVTPPVRVQESPRDKRCPEGFQTIGKQCVQTVHAPAEVVCPHGTEQIDGKCAKIVGKHQVCPIGFEEEDGRCVRATKASPEVHCPPGFVLVEKNQCAKKVQGPPRHKCPGGSVAKGDQCVQQVAEAAKHVCPNGFKQFDGRCVNEETFDCTPPRKPVVHTKGGKKGPTVKEEFVLQSTCKRVTSEPARTICEKGSRPQGKHCIKEVEVEPIVIPGAFREVFAPVLVQCPKGTMQDEEGKECRKVEFAKPSFVCPPSTVDLGQKCAVFQPAKIVCPRGFSLENDHQCVKTVFAAPIVEFSVTFKCTGKNCAQGKEHHRW